MKYRASEWLAFTLLGLILLSASVIAVVCSVSSVYVYVHQKEQPYHWPGTWFGSYYAGAAYVDVRSTPLGNTPGGETTLAYCIDYDGPIYIGTEYPVTLKPADDTQNWRKIAYILTWYHPPEDDDAGVCIQGAIWKILDNFIPNFIPNEYHTGINTLVDEAASKDVIREDDQFEWISPKPGNNTHLVADPGETIALQARITDSNGDGRSGVKVVFSLEGGGSLNRDVGWTDTDGVVEVEVTVPDHVADVKVKASTKGVWPQKYLDLPDNKQNLIGIDTTYQLTVSTKLWIFAFIHVVPEIPLGTLAVVTTCLSALTIRKRRLRPKS